jgi:hypothetical protein
MTVYVHGAPNGVAGALVQDSLCLCVQAEEDAT